ncbi:hypothetical protein BJ742DRAFT_819529 [Cladochytrium replicatum]|nr:hypothetical protein BJ742DRAFT_819529 [Cladochytrium replicatum]
MAMALRNGTNRANATPAFADPKQAFLGGNFSSGVYFRDRFNSSCIPRDSFGNSTNVFIDEFGCGPVMVPGETVKLSYNLTYINQCVIYDNWFARGTLTFSCFDPTRRSTVLNVTFGGDKFSEALWRSGASQLVTTEVTVPGALSVESNSSSKSLGCLDLRSKATLSLDVISGDGDNTIVSLQVPFNLDLYDRQFVPPVNETTGLLDTLGEDNITSIVFSIVAVIIIAGWAYFILRAYKTRVLRHAEASQESADAKTMLREGDDDDDLEAAVVEGSRSTKTRVRSSAEISKLRMNFLQDILLPRELDADALMKLATFSSGVRTIIDQQGIEEVQSPKREDSGDGKVVSSTPPASRIDTLGRTGLSIMQVIPYRLISIGESTIVVNWFGNLLKLPQVFNYLSSIWLVILFMIFLFAVAGLIAYQAGTGQLDLNVGFFWAIGGFGLAFSLLFMQFAAPVAPKGMLRLFRSIAAPSTEEFMFSYSWAVKAEDVRTLARAMYDIGLHVWIDVLKLISGSAISETVMNAVRDVNTVVVFLSPQYLRSFNCSTELLEALRHPAKVHLHVLEWSEKVYNTVDLLVTEFGIPEERLTAHQIDPKTPKFELTSKIAKLNNLVLHGEGWFALGAILHAYSKDDNDAFDFYWWINSASSYGGIPTNAPYPNGIKPYNFRLLLPWTVEYAGRNSVRVGSVWISKDCRKTGTKASAFPWVIFVLSVFALLPLADLALIGTRESDILQLGRSCANELWKEASNTTAPNNLPTLYAICRRFHRSRPFQTELSAFGIQNVKGEFDNLYNNLPVCQSHPPAFWLNILDIDDVTAIHDCTWELQYYFNNRSFRSPRHTQYPFVALFILLFSSLVLINSRRALRINAPPTCVRPLLATANLRGKSKGGLQVLKKKLDKTAEDGAEIDWLVADVKVAVHGTGIVADCLREFLDNMGFLADPHWFDTYGGIIDRHASQVKPREDLHRAVSSSTMSTADINTITNADEESEASGSNTKRDTGASSTLTDMVEILQRPSSGIRHRNHKHAVYSDTDEAGTFTRGSVAKRKRLNTVLQQVVNVPFAWVDVYVVSTAEFRDKIYEIRKTLRLKQAVFIIAPDDPKANILERGSPVTAWYSSILYINATTDPDTFAATVMENVSIRTKDALLSYGQASFNLM